MPHSKVVRIIVTLFVATVFYLCLVHVVRGQTTSPPPVDFELREVKSTKDVLPEEVKYLKLIDRKWYVPVCRKGDAE